jgi:NtrC-family two-component system sensor histidine kinase KinB
MKNLSLFHRFFVIMAGVAIVPLLVVTAYLYHYQKIAKENTLEFHRQLATFSANAINDYMGGLNRRLGFVQDLERVSGGDKLEAFKILQEALVTNPDFAVLSVLDPEGKETVKLADTKFPEEVNPTDRSKDPTFKEVAENGLVDISPAHELGGQPVITIVYPMKTGEYAFLDVDLSTLWKKLQATKIGKTGRVQIVDEDGKVLPGFESDKTRVKATVLKSMLKEEEGALDHVPASGGVMVGGYHHVPSTKWYVMTVQPQGEAFLAASRMQIELAFFLAVVAALAFGVAYVVAGRIAEPILDLTRWALRVAKNDYTKSVGEPGWGELNTLARTCNQMMKELKAYHELQIDRILEEKSKVETLVYTIPDGLVMANFKGELLYINTPAMSVLGLDPKMTHTPKGVFDVIRQDKLRKAVESALQKNEKVEDVEVQVEEPDGNQKKYYNTKATIVTTPEKKDVGVLLIMHDITFEKEMEKMKEAFFHSVAHDLRAPIFGVQGYLHLLEKRVKPGPVEKGYFSAMYQSCDKLIALVKDILDVAQLESGTVKLDVSEVDIGALCTKVHAAFVPVAIDRGLEMMIDLAPGDHGKVVCDERLTDRVLSNLISNALKFTPSPGSVTLHLVKSDSGSVTLDVSDTGPGIPPDKAGKLFGKFQQLETAQKSQGFGLGLNICKTVIEMQGGRIWVESEGIPGKGSHFKFMIPRTPPPENIKPKLTGVPVSAPAAAPNAPKAPVTAAAPLNPSTPPS